MKKKTKNIESNKMRYSLWKAMACWIAFVASEHVVSPSNHICCNSSFLDNYSLLIVPYQLPHDAEATFPEEWNQEPQAL